MDKMKETQGKNQKTIKMKWKHMHEIKQNTRKKSKAKKIEWKHMAYGKHQKRKTSNENTWTKSKKTPEKN